MNQLTINTGEETHTFDIKPSGELLMDKDSKHVQEQDNVTRIECKCGNSDTIDYLDNLDNTSKFMLLSQSESNIEYFCLECEEDLIIEKEN